MALLIGGTLTPERIFAQSTTNAPLNPEPFSERALSLGRIYLPDAYRPENGQIDLLIHFHGHPPVVKQNLLASGKRAVLVIINQNGLSEAYAAPFRPPGKFTNL